MKKRYVLLGGHYADCSFMAVSNDDPNDCIGCDTIDDAIRAGTERWGKGQFDVEECILADGKKIGWMLRMLY